MADRIDNDDFNPGILRFLEPAFVLMRGRVRWISAPDQDRPCVPDRPRIKTFQRIAEYKLKRGVTSLVADRVRIDFRRANSIEQTNGKPTADQPNGSGIVSVQDRTCMTRVDQTAKPFCNLAEGLFPGDRDKLC